MYEKNTRTVTNDDIAWTSERDSDGNCDDFGSDRGMSGTTTTTTVVRDYTTAVTYVSTTLVLPPKPADNDNAAMYVCARERRSCVRCGAGPLRCGSGGGDMRERFGRVRTACHSATRSPVPRRSPRTA